MKHYLLPALNLTALALILLLAAVIPGAAMLGALAAVPVLVASSTDQRRWLLLTAVAGGAGFLGLLLRASTAPPPAASEWLIPALCIAAAAGAGSVLQERRLRAIADRHTAEAASDMNRLLMSLLAHDLRSPLVLADQAFQNVEESCAGGYPVDPGMVADVRARLHRSLRAIEMVLAVAAEQEDADSAVRGGPVSVAAEIAAEVDSFGYEAAARGKHLVKELEALPAEPVGIDARVLRQSIAIALDNAVRYADAGAITVRAELAAAGGATTLDLRIEDVGPGIGETPSDHHHGGSGLGLRLCAALLTRAGGSLTLERDGADGTTVAIRMPVGAMAEPARRPARLQTAGV